MNNELATTTIKIVSRMKYLLDIYPELEKYKAIQRLVSLAKDWDCQFDRYIGKDKESHHA